VDDSLLIRCTKCKGSFRDKARRVQNGYSRQCPLCERVLFFEESTPDKNVQKALVEARQLRKVLREREAPKRSSAPFRFGR
jgi:NAD-dependent SIR2 family protein deacetylase